MSTGRIKHVLFRYDSAIAILLICAGLVGWVWVGKDNGWRIMITFSSGGAAFFYFVQRQKLEETRLMKELFTEFNRRYDGLNGPLAKITPASSSPLSRCQRETVIDYFNLCAEEHLFNTLGYIEPNVWEAWQEGMKAVYEQDERIQDLWKEEKQKNHKSYYGFDFPLVT